MHVNTNVFISACLHASGVGLCVCVCVCVDDSGKLIKSTTKSLSSKNLLFPNKQTATKNVVGLPQTKKASTDNNNYHALS